MIRHEARSNSCKMVRVRRIELRFNAWEALVLPLNYTRQYGVRIPHIFLYTKTYQSQRYFFPYFRIASMTSWSATPFFVNAYSTCDIRPASSFLTIKPSFSRRFSLLESVRLLMPESEFPKSLNRRGFSNRSRNIRSVQESPKMSATRATGHFLHKSRLCCWVRNISTAYHRFAYFTK